MHALKTQIINVSGCQVHTLQGGDKNKPTLFFLHGKAFQAETWRELRTLQTAIDAGFFVIAVDLPGFGKTPEADVTPETVIINLMQAAKLQKIILIGPSMGGKIALEFSLAHPDYITGLVLIGAVGVEENRNQLRNLPKSTLIIWGENDQISDPANGKLLNDQIDGSTLVIFQGAKHPCYLEQVTLWHKTLMDFAVKV
jgi:abhydrolase domain-containing protein 14